MKITRLDGTAVDVATLTQRIDRKIRSSVKGEDGETFGYVVVKSIHARSRSNCLSAHAIWISSSPHRKV